MCWRRTDDRAAVNPTTSRPESHGECGAASAPANPTPSVSTGTKYRQEMCIGGGVSVTALLASMIGSGLTVNQPWMKNIRPLLSRSRSRRRDSRSDLL